MVTPSGRLAASATEAALGPPASAAGVWPLPLLQPSSSLQPPLPHRRRVHVLEPA